jgi:hypothetical protein
MAQEVEAPMQNQGSPRGFSSRNSSLAPAEQDAIVQHALLELVLAEHPAQLTIAELIRELADDPDDFGERDDVERAVRDLGGVGLLHRQGICVWPSRAALHFERLDSRCSWEQS